MLTQRLEQSMLGLGAGSISIFAWTWVKSERNMHV